MLLKNLIQRIIIKIILSERFEIGKIKKELE